MHGTVIWTEDGSKTAVIKGIVKAHMTLPLMTVSLLSLSVLVTVPCTCKAALHGFLHLYIGL